MSKVTQFWDMHSGGGTKVPPYEKIYIEAPEEEAIRVFYARFGRNPNRVTCTCCGRDYAIEECDDIAQATAFHRNCDYEGERYVERQREEWSGKYMTVEQYFKQRDVLFISAAEIKEEERSGPDPEPEGYVWQ